MPTIRADIVDVYVFRRLPSGAIELLQLLRAADKGSNLDGTWQPVMGHVEIGETAVACAWRELAEEVGLARGDAALLGMWALEQVHPYFLAHKDQIVMSARFACEVRPDWQPRLNHEHTDARWVAADEARNWFMWPGQLAAINEIVGSLLAQDSLSLENLRIQ